MKIPGLKLIQITPMLLLNRWWLRLSFILLLHLNTFSFSTLAQTKLWDKTLGGYKSDQLNSLQQTSDGGYILGGYSNSDISGDKTEASKGNGDCDNSCSGDYWVVKLDASGQKQWDKTIGGTGIDNLTSLQQTFDGGYILGGYSNSDINGDKTEARRDTGRYENDYWVVKLRADGSKEWDKTLGGSKSEQLSSLQQTQDGGYILGGSSLSGISGDKSQANKGAADFWIVKLNAAGQKEWDKTIGGSKEDGLRSLQQTQDGGYILGGYSYSPISGDKTEHVRGNNGDSDYWVVKVDANGEKEWDKTFGGNSSEQLSSLQQTQDGGYILGGYSFSDKNGDKTQANKGGGDFWIVKLNADGTLAWDKTIGGSNWDLLTSLQQTSDGGYMLGGISGSEIGGDKTQASKGNWDYWIVKLNAVGQKEWDKTLGGDSGEFLTSLQQTSDGGYILGGYSLSRINGDKSEDSRGAYDYWVVKLTEEVAPPPVNTVWNLRYGGSATDRFTVVIKTQDGGYLSGGYSNSELSGDKSQASRGGADYWIVKTDVNGVKQWDKRFGGTNHDYLNRIIPTTGGGYLLAGSSTSGKGGDKSEGRRGDQDYWIVKITSAGTKQWDKTYGGRGFDDLRKVNQLSNGDYLLAGTSDSEMSGEKSQMSQGGKDYWILRVSNIGNKLWDKTYGGSGEENLESFTKTSTGGFLLAGTSTSGVSGNKSQASRGDKDYWLVRINSNGTQLWDKSYGGEQDDELYSIGITNSGEYFVAGHSSSGQSGDKSQASQGASDYWMLKLSSTGEKLWDKSFGGSGVETLRSIIQVQGGYLLAGSSDSPISGDKTQASQGSTDYWIIKTDAQGNKEYDQRFGGSGQEEFRYIQRTADGGLLLGGRSESGVSGDRTQPSQGDMDYWLVKVMPPTTVAARQVVAEVNNALTPERPLKLQLAVYPNPTSGQAVTMAFSVPETQPVSLQVYDSQGKAVTTLYQGQVQAHQVYQVEWQPRVGQARGLYVLRLVTPHATGQQKIMLLR